MRHISYPHSRPTRPDLDLLGPLTVIGGRRAADLPPPVAVCDGCGAVADLPAAGWATAPAPDGNATGVCPACRRAASTRIG